MSNDASRGAAPDFGALVVSLDFELHWGVRDLAPPSGPYRANLLGAREAVPRLLALFEELGVAATWAVVGFLFARSREELERYRPAVTPAYADPALSPYGEPVGDGEEDDPLHFAPSLIAAIRATPRQELATHTYSHYYCLAPGQDGRAFAADLASAVAIAERDGVRPCSIVFPRNQHNPAYAEILREAGITCYRGNQRAWLYRATRGRRPAALARGVRLLDAYVGLAGPHTVRWEEVVARDGLADVPASFFFRPHSPRLRRLEPLRLRRLERSVEHAARAREIVHLWWHPHNFGRHLPENLAALRRVLEVFDRQRRERGMRSLTMGEVATLARCANAQQA